MINSIQNKINVNIIITIIINIKMNILIIQVINQKEKELNVIPVENMATYHLIVGHVNMVKRIKIMLIQLEIDIIMMPEQMNQVQIVLKEMLIKLYKKVGRKK